MTRASERRRRALTPAAAIRFILNASEFAAAKSPPQ
jgi:hypothetical protein